MAAFPDVPFTLAMAAEAGLSRRSLDLSLRQGRVRRVVRGVYAPAALPDDVATRARCLQLVTPPGCVVVDRHAGWLLGAEMVLAPGEHLELRPLSLFRRSGHGRLRNGSSTSGERALSSADVMEVDGLAVTTPLRTACDLGRVRQRDQAIAGLDAMLRLGRFEPAELVAEVERFAAMRWVTTLRELAPFADGRAESPPESILRLRCHDVGLTGLVPQVEVHDHDGLVARLDLGDERRRVGVEYDGDEWHSSPTQLLHDRRRRARAADTGWEVEVFTKADLFGQHRRGEARLDTLRETWRARPLRAA